MNEKTQKYTLFGVGLAALVGAALLADRPEIAQALSAVGGLLLGWAGFRRPGDTGGAA